MVTADTIIETEAIRTRFGSNEVHRGVSFSVKRGEIVAVIGGSGTGKTVLLRELLGLMRPTSGKIQVLGVDILTASPSKVEATMRRVGVLFQTGALFSAMTVGENIAAPLREQTTLPDDCIHEIVRLRLLLSGLLPSDQKKLPAELSGGMIKRAALARALALEPELLILDEPTSGLDPINARAFDELIKTLAKSLGITVFLITHDLDTLRAVPDRIVVLADGIVLAQAPYQEVEKLNHPWVRSYFHGTER